MITIEYLEKINADSMEAYRSSDGDEKCLHNYRAESAQGAIEFMKEHNLTEVEIIGPFYNGLENDPRLNVRGTKIKIKKGALIRSTGPQHNTVARRDRIVTLFDFDQGYCHRSAKFEEYRTAKVTWVGASGYWCYTDLNNIEILE